MPISALDGYPASHWEAVFSIIKEALSETKFFVELVSNSDEIGVIQKRIVQNIYDNEIIICDVSAKNPNVMFELGMRLAFDKPAIIIKDDRTNYSFDTAQIEHLEYPRELNYHLIQAFKTKLREKVVATFEASKNSDYTTFLKHFGHFIVADIEEKKVSRDSYLLEAISELRKDIAVLGRRVESNFSRRVTEDIFAKKAHERVEALAGGSTAERVVSGMLDFIRNYLENADPVIAAEFGRNPNFPFLEDIFRDYFSKYGVFFSSQWDAKTLKTMFIEAAEQVRQGRKS